MKTGEASKWIKWPGGRMPVRKGTLVCVRHRSGTEYLDVRAGESYAEDWYYGVGSSVTAQSDIVAYYRSRAVRRTTLVKEE